MRRSLKSSANRLSSDSSRLISYAQALVQAFSRIEERAWECELDHLLQKLLRNNHQDTIDAALDHLFKARSEAYDALMEAVEAASESNIFEHEGKRFHALLIAAPILAWTRFAIASGPIPADMVATLSAHVYGHILADNTRMALSPMLYSIDQLPRTHVDTYLMTQRLAHAALHSTAVRASANTLETVPFLADTRYLLATVVAEVDAPIFRWQTPATAGARNEAHLQWNAQAHPNIARLLPGCGVELLRPDAYFMSCREADRQIRPASIKAALHYLTHTLDTTADCLSAVIGGFAEDTVEGRIDEYRISFVPRPGAEVVYGLVWPLYGEEDGEEQLADAGELATRAASTLSAVMPPLAEIVQLLRQEGVVHIKQHAEVFPIEFCDDCGAPLYCDLEGELVHAEMPEDTSPSAPHLH
jgi:hypothetical protein